MEQGAQQGTKRTVAFSGTVQPEQLKQWFTERLGVEVLPSERYMEADFLVCDNFNFNHETFKGVKIMLTGENHAADLYEYDYCLSHELVEDDRRHRFPYWQFHMIFGWRSHIACLDRKEKITAKQLLAQNRKFCAFVCKNGACRKRNTLVSKLAELGLVDCGGPWMNNLGYCVDNKVEFQSGYYFSVAYENEQSPGYQTEKIIDALISHSIPLYWGNPLVAEEFNPACFVDARNFRNEDEMVAYLQELAKDADRMAEMLNVPVFRQPDTLKKAEEELYAFLSKIIARGPGAIQRTRMQRMLAVLRRYWGHGLFRSLRRFSRWLRGKKPNCK